MIKLLNNSKYIFFNFNLFYLKFNLDSFQKLKIYIFFNFYKIYLNII